MQSIIKEFKGTTDQLILTDGHLYLLFGSEANERYCVNLANGKHQFLVRYLEANNPLIAAYLPDGNGEEAIEIETFIINVLQDLDFIWKVEIYSEKEELTRPRNHPQDCLITVDISKISSEVE